MQLKVSWRPRGKSRRAFKGSDEEGSNRDLAWETPCFLGSGATTVESEKQREKQEDGENVLPWKLEEEGVPRGRE